MNERFDVVYENGLLRPVSALPRQFQEHERLTLTLEESIASTAWLEDADPMVSIDTVRRILGKTSNILSQMVLNEREER